MEKTVLPPTPGALPELPFVVPLDVQDVPAAPMVVTVMVVELPRLAAVMSLKSQV
jgi:hypothetical protein